MARVSTAPRIGPAQKPATPPTAPSRKVRTSPVPWDDRRCSRSRPGRTRARSKPTPRAWAIPSPIMSTDAPAISRERWVTRIVPSAPAPIPSGTSVSARPAKNRAPWLNRPRRVEIVEAKKPGSSSAPQGLSSARVPPRNAVTRPTSISALRFRERLVHQLGEVLRGLGADRGSPPDDEGGRGHGPDVDALLRGGVERILDLGGGHHLPGLVGVATATARCRAEVAVAARLPA